MIDLIGPFIVLIVVVGIIILSVTGAFSRRHCIVLDYQRGVKFKDGIFSEILLPGCYRIHPKNDLVEIVDLRPQPFLFEALSCTDAIDHRLILSFTGEMFVVDPKQAVARTTKDTNEGLSRIPQAARTAASHLIVPIVNQQLAMQVQESLFAALNHDLSEVGLKVCHFELTEIWASPTKHGLPEEMA